MPNLLLQHLFDAAAVAELMWDDYVAPVVRYRLDACCGGRGREFFAFVCGLHDLGKATPAFQCKDAGLAQRVIDDGYPIGRLDRESRGWHHSAAGGRILFDETFSAESEEFAWEWVWPLIAGHHGRVPGFDRLVPRLRVERGPDPWPAAQSGLIATVAAAVGASLEELAPVGAPSRGVQLAVAGLVVMADWIASDEHYFVGVDRPEDVSMEGARGRARRAWTALRLRGGWVLTDPVAAGEVFRGRFEADPRDSQRDVVALAEAMAAPGLLIVEAPMGEGKTKAALAAAEVLAGKFGADGIFVGMPTQATSDPMFSIVTRWSAAIDAAAPVALLHGKRRFNKQWRDIEARARYSSVGDDEFGCGDPYCADVGAVGSVPAEWLFGRNRGLLTPVTVGVIDHLLFAGTRTKHVMLRHAGLVGKVVVLDEVHAYDVYMGQFLFEALRWLGDAKVPVILLSATLPAPLRASLVQAYMQGALQRRDIEPSLPELVGYPSVLAVSVGHDGEVRVAARESAPFRESLPVRVEVIQEGPGRPSEDPERGVWPPDPVVAAVVEEVREGGCVLVIRNVVARAQDTYLALKAAVSAEFGAGAGDDMVRLLHGQLTMGQKVSRVEAALEELGPPQDGRVRPARRIIVATQLAEQSFDVDADLLVTDLAPIDLLLQRIGRLHRHTRPRQDRPVGLGKPRVMIAGMQWGAQGPVFPAGSVSVYGRAALLRAAALVFSAGKQWSIPAEVPRLVAQGYADEPGCPQAWAEMVQQAEQMQRAEDQKRRNAADRYLLAGQDGLGHATLAGLHARSMTVSDNEDDAFAVVRDGDPAVEVILLQRSAKRTWVTVDGTVDIGPNGDAVSDFEVLEKVAASMIRLPRSLGAAAAELEPLPGWEQDPWLRRVPVLEIVDGTAELGGKRLAYNPELGLVVERIMV